MGRTTRGHHCSFLQTQQGRGTLGLTAAVPAHTRPVPAHANQSPACGVGGHEVPPLAEERLAVGRRWEAVDL